MLYDRKIKYVDYYENGERVKGGGFVKLEVRDGFLKMNLHIKGLYPTDSFVRDVVLSSSDTEAVLGQITLQGGVGCFNYSCETALGIGNTGISYEDLQEIKIPVGGSRELCCTWKETAKKTAMPVEPTETEGRERESAEAGLAEPESPKPESPELKSMVVGTPMTEDEGVGLQEAEAQKPEVHGAESQETEAQEAEAQEEAHGAEAQETEAQVAETQEEKLQQTEVRETALQEAALRTAVTQKATGQQTATQETATQETATQETGTQKMAAQETTTWETAVQETESQAAERQQAETIGLGFREAENVVSEPEQKPAVKLLEDKWQQLSAIYPHIRPFKDEREYLSLSPSDFVLFPESYYRAANNSFLLHGFYNYKHLILARVERRSEVRYYLGVPGNYYEREKQVAVMFGFESFECDREPAKTGDFGYYLMRMEL